MPRQPLPRDLRQALDRLEAEPGRLWSLDDIATACGVAQRTLQKHFRRFLDRTPLEFLRELRLDRARQELLRAPPTASVTEIALGCGFRVNLFHGCRRGLADVTFCVVPQAS